MELRQLEHFVAVAEEAHFTRASSRCHVSQSALSTSVKMLEREFGVTLFLRTTRRVALTEAGRTLLPEARRTLAAAAAARSAVDEVQTLLRGSLRAGGIPTPGLLDQPAVVAEFCSRHPMVEISYTRDTSMALIPAVVSGRLDIALVSIPAVTPPGLAVTTLVTEPIMLVCRPDHRLAHRRAVSVPMLAKETFVTLPYGTTVHAAVDSVFASTGAEPRAPFVVNDILTVLDFVASGLGVGLIQRYLATSRDDLCAIPLTGRTMTWTLGAVTPELDSTNAAARELLDLLRSAVRGS